MSIEKRDISNDVVDLGLSVETLKLIFEKESSKIVGKVMRRFEIFSNLDSIKQDVKELLYESLRDLKDLIILAGMGKEPTYWEFK